MYSGKDSASIINSDIAVYGVLDDNNNIEPVSKSSSLRSSDQVNPESIENSFQLPISDNNRYSTSGQSSSPDLLFNTKHNQIMSQSVQREQLSLLNVSSANEMRNQSNVLDCNRNHPSLIFSALSGPHSSVNNSLDSASKCEHRSFNNTHKNRSRIVDHRNSDLNVTRRIQMINSGIQDNCLSAVTSSLSTGVCNSDSLDSIGSMRSPMNMVTNSPCSDSPHAVISPSAERSVRLARNVAEKQRRDKLNAYIANLANTVPLVSSATKRLDKTSILRLSAAYLRLHESPLSALAHTPSHFTQSDGAHFSSPHHQNTNFTIPSPYSSSSSSTIIQCHPPTNKSHINSPGASGNHSPISPFARNGSNCQISLNTSKTPSTGCISRWKPRSFTNSHLKTLMESIDGFLIVLNHDLKLIYVSQTCEKFLGHANIDMMGHQIGHFIHPGDCDAVSGTLESAKKNLIQSSHSMSERIQLRCRLKERSQPRTEMVTYQMVNISGVFEVCCTDESEKTVPQADNMDVSFSTDSTVACLQGQKRKMEQTEDSCELRELKTTVHSNCLPSSKRNRSTYSPVPSKNHYTSAFLSRNLLFKGFVQVIASSPAAELSLIDANQEEYVTRMTLDGVFLYADHRLSMVTGYTPSEILGKSAYAYILVPDHVISLFAHKLMLSNSNGTGIVVHRLRQRTGSYVYIQSAGCLQYDRSTGQVDHFVCVSRLLRDDEGDKERQKFVRKFTPHVTDDSPLTLYESLQLVIGPRNSRAVNYQSCVTSFNSLSDDNRSSSEQVIASTVTVSEHALSSSKSNPPSVNCSMTKSGSSGLSYDAASSLDCASTSPVSRKISSTTIACQSASDDTAGNWLPIILPSTNAQATCSQDTQNKPMPSKIVSCPIGEEQSIGQPLSPSNPLLTQLSSPSSSRFSHSTASIPATVEEISSNRVKSRSHLSSNVNGSNVSFTSSDISPLFDLNDPFSNYSNNSASNNPCDFPSPVPSSSSQLTPHGTSVPIKLVSSDILSESDEHRVYVNLPPNASFIREDGFFMDTSTVIPINSLPPTVLQASRSSISQPVPHVTTACQMTPEMSCQLGKRVSETSISNTNINTSQLIDWINERRTTDSLNEAQTNMVTHEKIACLPSPGDQLVYVDDKCIVASSSGKPFNSRSNHRPSNPSAPNNLNDLKNLLDPNQSNLINQLLKHATSERFIPFTKASPSASMNIDSKVQQHQANRSNQQQQELHHQRSLADYVGQQTQTQHEFSKELSSSNVTSASASNTDMFHNIARDQVEGGGGHIVFSGERLMSQDASSMSGAYIFTFNDRHPPQAFTEEDNSNKCN